MCPEGLQPPHPPTPVQCPHAACYMRDFRDLCTLVCMLEDKMREGPLWEPQYHRVGEGA
jgi:hypothetical protein